MRTTLLLLIATLLGCSDHTGLAPSGEVRAAEYLTALVEPGDYNALATNIGEIKFVLQADGRAATSPVIERCLFQDTTQFSTHLQFLRWLPGGERLSYDVYEGLALRRVTRVWWTGALRYWPTLSHPVSGEAGVYTFTIAPGPNTVDLPAAADIVSVGQQLRECGPLMAGRLVFMPTSPETEVLLQDDSGPLDDVGLGWLAPEQISVDDGTLVLSTGQGFGYLRIAPSFVAPDSYGPQDVVISALAPADLGVVASLITTTAQSPSGPLAIRLAEAGVPNAAVPNILNDPAIVDLEGRLVRVVMTSDDVEITPATAAQAEEHWATIRPGVVVPDADLSQRALRGFDALRHADGTAYGARAAVLGELRHILPPESSLPGFGVPFVHYQEFVERNDLAMEIQAVVQNPQLATDAERRASALRTLRSAFRQQPISGALWDQLTTTLYEQLGPGAETMRLRLSGSANLAQLKGFSGRGLYGITSGCLADDLDADDTGPSRCLTSGEIEALGEHRATWESYRAYASPDDLVWIDEILDDIEGYLDRERRLSDGIRTIWSRAWTERAYAERSWYGLPQTAIIMGIAVSPALVLEQLNVSALTNLDGGDLPLYRLATRPGAELRGDPTLVDEIMSFSRGPDGVTGASVLVPSSHGSSPLWTDEHLQTLALRLFTVQDHFASYRLTVPPAQLEVRAALTADGRVVITGARPGEE